MDGIHGRKNKRQPLGLQWRRPARGRLPLRHEAIDGQQLAAEGFQHARHGYVFKSPELQAYFATQPWYKPVEGAGEAQLSELEKLNARILAEKPNPRQ